ncbi:hypothetical protein [Candidatus Hydrogenosomobacter endosymbioticus]|uniref:Uncharacterized protein n=1 Tax=Candidatus Hydrogenosomobacter endosymbioticus TaxID=2558174 RepID=A0ABM7V925_9PROT|nr:hypothetical protein [Candidatus Hydrogenosomobacter endosymbioticus]BDB96287.1 hypothetical protein HYD_4200 [Candidatus Hydrogenosomobacter endosymbioticus]
MLFLMYTYFWHGKIFLLFLAQVIIVASVSEASNKDNSCPSEDTIQKFISRYRWTDKTISFLDGRLDRWYVRIKAPNLILRMFRDMKQEALQAKENGSEVQFDERDLMRKYFSSEFNNSRRAQVFLLNENVGMQRSVCEYGVFRSRNGKVVYSVSALVSDKNL